MSLPPNGNWRLGNLVELARDALPRMWNRQTGLFSHKAVPAGAQFHNTGSNTLYSAISAIGLLMIERPSRISPPDLVPRTLDALVDSAASSRSGSLLGTTLWALVLGEHPGSVGVIDSLLERFDIHSSSSMELGLALAGVSAAVEHSPTAAERLGSFPDSIRGELCSRFSRTARLFRGSRRRASAPRALLHHRITSFASQVYAIHGLAEHARVQGVRPAEEACLAADRLVELQGEEGQWWWFYAVPSGRVLDGYPVYSVHQHAMAFMALAPLQNLGASRFETPLSQGLRWVAGDNELGETLIDEPRSLVYRCIQRRGSSEDRFGGISRANQTRLLLSSYRVARAAGIAKRRDSLVILRECRSYELGWLLYASRLTRGWDW